MPNGGHLVATIRTHYPSLEYRNTTVLMQSRRPGIGELIPPNKAPRPPKFKYETL